MEFSLRPDEILPVGLRRVVAGQLETAARALHPLQTDFDTGVYEARKAFKRIRAVLRLARGGLEPGVFKAENHCFRGAGRQLAAARDGLVLRLSLTDLAVVAPDPRSGAYLSDLAQRASAATDAGELWRGDVIAGLNEVLAVARLRAGEWALEDHGFETIRPGFQRTYRQGRKRMRKAFESGDDQAYHSWRRRAKELWYQLQLLEPIRPDEIGPLVEDLDALGEALGTDHDLVLARQTVAGDGEHSARDYRVEVLGLIDERIQGLRERSRALGLAVYRSGPRKFVARMESYWLSARIRSDTGNGEPKPGLIEVRG
jgi:CHAD domain-containing protein